MRTRLQTRILRGIFPQKDLYTGIKVLSNKDKTRNTNKTKRPMIDTKIKLFMRKIQYFLVEGNFLNII